MVAESLKQDPLPEQLLWSGEVHRTKWKVYCIEVNHPVREEFDEQKFDEYRLADSSDPFWRLRFENQDGESFETTWSPQNRIIFGTLSGWSKSAIGDLKNALIQHRWQGSKQFFGRDRSTDGCS